MSTVDEILIAATQRVLDLERQLDNARGDRARTYALAQQRHGRSAGDISRLLGPAITPDKVGSEIRVGRRLNEIAWRTKAEAAR